jgi:hypothetical protein
MQMLLLAVLVHASHTFLKNAEITFGTVGIDDAIGRPQRFATLTSNT